jgi:effector-binding domain-containing protein
MYEIEERKLEKQPTMVVKGTVEVKDMGVWIGGAYGRIVAYLAEEGIEPAAGPFARYRPLGDHRFEVEAGFPVSAVIPGKGDVEPSMLPDGPAVATWHIGPYDTMEPAYAALSEWIHSHGYLSAGVAWEVYYSDPETEPDPQKWRTEIVQPYS